MEEILLDERWTLREENGTIYPIFSPFIDLDDRDFITWQWR